jgi:hypothetical protein
MTDPTCANMGEAAADTHAQPSITLPISRNLTCPSSTRGQPVHSAGVQASEALLGLTSRAVPGSPNFEKGPTYEAHYRR